MTFLNNWERQAKLKPVSEMTRRLRQTLVVFQFTHRRPVHTCSSQFVFPCDSTVQLCSLQGQDHLEKDGCRCSCGSVQTVPAISEFSAALFSATIGKQQPASGSNELPLVVFYIFHWLEMDRSYYMRVDGKEATTFYVLIYFIGQTIIRY